MFVVAHFHMVMGVAPIMVIFGAIYHWYPKITGRMLDETMGRFHFWVTFVGAYAIFFPMHYVGLVGVPRRYLELGETAFVTTPVDGLNAFIIVAALVVGFAQMVFLFNLFWSIRHGRDAGGNPWRATSLEWQTPRDPARRTATGAGSCRSSTAGPTTTACRARRRTSSPRTTPGRTRRRSAHERHPRLHPGGDRLLGLVAAAAAG